MMINFNVSFVVFDSRIRTRDGIHLTSSGAKFPWLLHKNMVNSRSSFRSTYTRFNGHNSKCQLDYGVCSCSVSYYTMPPLPFNATGKVALEVTSAEVGQVHLRWLPHLHLASLPERNKNIL